MIFHSSFQYSYLWLPLIGLFVGMLASMIGGGGGFLFPPALILFFQIPAHIAVTTSLAATLPICFAGAVGHYRLGNIDMRTGLVFGIAGILGAIAGAFFTGLVTAKQLQYIFGIYLILLAIIVKYGSGNKHKSSKQTNNPSPVVRLFDRIPKGTFYGLSGGVISGTFGTSGTAPVLAGLFAIRLPIKLVAGTSLMIIFINTFSALAGHIFVGIIDLTLVWFLTSGAILGAFFGPRITKRWKVGGKKEGIIKQSYALVILVLGIILLIF